MFEDDEDFENLEFDAGILEEKSRKIRNFIFTIKSNGIELEIGIVFLHELNFLWKRVLFRKKNDGQRNWSFIEIKKIIVFKTNEKKTNSSKSFKRVFF